MGRITTHCIERKYLSTIMRVLRANEDLNPALTSITLHVACVKLSHRCNILLFVSYFRVKG
jgi:hypothetical protein